MRVEEAFYIGYITKTKGLKGEVQLFFEYDEPELLELDVVFADINGKMVPFFVSSYKLHSNGTGNFYFDDVDYFLVCIVIWQLTPKYTQLFYSYLCQYP